MKNKEKNDDYIVWLSLYIVDFWSFQDRFDDYGYDNVNHFIHDNVFRIFNDKTLYYYKC